MKVIQVPYCFYPDPIGGTEIYVETLSMRLQELGIQNVIVAPADKNASYLHNNILVRRFAFSNKINDLSELYNEGDPASAAEFGKVLDEEKPDIVHLHALTRAVSVYVVREAKKRGLPVIFTYHTPTVSCQRGTLMLWGKKVCDGKILFRCAACTLQGLGLPKPIAFMTSLTPIWFGNLLGFLKLSGGIWTGLRMRALINMRQSNFHKFMNEVNHVISLCQWTTELLLCNNVAKDKISIIEHGIFFKTSKQDIQKDNQLNEPALKIIYIGRLHPVKGINVIVQALRLIPNANVKLDIYGIIQCEADRRYLLKLKKLTNADSRIIFKDYIPNAEVMQVLKDYHILAVPSVWLETGPLTILEAFSTGIPVLGSNLGGIAELVNHEVNGLLVEAGSVRAWADAIKRLYEDRGLLKRLRKNVSVPKGAEEMMQEMIVIYKKCLN